MQNAALIYPVLAQVFLTVALMVLMAVKRVGGAQARRYKVRDIAVDNRNYPADLIKYGNAYSNQFELPVLFYLWCVLLMITGQAGSQWYIALAWAFVAMRYVHAFIHVTSNHVIRRFYAFLASAIILLIMWVHYTASFVIFNALLSVFYEFFKS